MACRTKEDRELPIELMGTMNMVGISCSVLRPMAMCAARVTSMHEELKF